jgi:hypothetical protein
MKGENQWRRSPPLYADLGDASELQVWGMGRRRGQYKRMAAVGSRGVLGVGYLAPDFYH